MFKNNFDTKQRFGIRKSTKWKTAGSVLLGTYAILSLNTGLASADEITQPVATDPAIAAVQPAAETSPAIAEGDALNAVDNTLISEAAPTVVEPAADVTASEPAAEVAGISPDTEIAVAGVAAEGVTTPSALERSIAEQPTVESNVDLSFQRTGKRDTTLSETEAYSGEALDFYANIAVTGVSDTYKDAELTLTLQQSELINARFNQENLSGDGQNQAVKALDSDGNTTYTIKLGDLISGQSISLPFRFAFKNNLDANKQATLALEAYAVIDGKRTLISSAETIVTNRTIPKPEFDLALTGSNNIKGQFDEDRIQIFNAGNVQDKTQDGVYETVLSNNTQYVRSTLINADEYSDYMKTLISSSIGGDSSFNDRVYLMNPNSEEILESVHIATSTYGLMSRTMADSMKSRIDNVNHAAANLNGSLDGGASSHCNCKIQMASHTQTMFNTTVSLQLCRMRIAPNKAL